MIAPAMLIAIGAYVPPASASGATISGSGSSYAAVAINQWVAEIAAVNGDNINYQTSASVIGLNEFAQQQVDFAASEIGYSTKQANYTPPASFRYQYLPDVAGATCLMYNLSGPTGQPITSLRLDSQALTGIFTGAITSWNNAQIQALNPGVLLPSSAIVVVDRTDPSGDNYLFSNYLWTEHSSEWDTFAAALQFPSGPQAIWPTPQNGGSHAGYNFQSWVGQSGSDNASNYVASSTGTITYVETAYAILHNKPCAFIENASGHWLQPSEYGDAVALQADQLKPDLEQELSGVYANTSPAAYPISAYSYLVTPEGQMPTSKGAVLGRFIRFFACTGQEAAGRLGYSPLPPNLVEDDFKAISRINGAAAPPSAPTAANCPDPYLTDPGSLPGAAPAQGPGQQSGPTTSGKSPSGTGSGTKNKTTPAKGSGYKSTGSTGTSRTGALQSGTTASTQPSGLDLLAAAGNLQSHSSAPSLLMVASTLGVLLLLAGPGAIAIVRRSKKSRTTRTSP